MKILVVEDERSVAHVEMQALTEAGWHVDLVSDGIRGLEAALTEDYALVLLDVMLPGMSGWEVVKELRAKKSVIPILMTTALDGVDDKVKGLHLGADDYLVKPFELSELVARIESLIRRDHLSRDLVTRVADLEVDRKTRTVTRRGSVIRLTRREYDLLEALASNVGTAVDRDTLQRRVWTDNEAFEQTVDIFVRTLKQKIDAPFGHDLIHATDGGEYLLMDLDEPDAPKGVAESMLEAQPEAYCWLSV